MTDAGGQTPQPPLPSNANITALVEAIDARARQAGSDGAATLLRGMIGSVSEVLASIQDRLDRMEDLLADRDAAAGGGGGGAGSVAEQVQAGLATFNARLGRLEEAFVQAVEDSGSGTDAVVEQLRRTIVDALEAHTPASPSATAPAPVLDLGPQLEEAMNPIRARLTGLEQLIRARGGSGDDRSTGGDAAAAVNAALAPIAERLDGLEIAIRSATDATSERTAGERDKPALDPELVARLEAAIEHLGKDDATAKVVALVEERIGAGVRAVVERAEATGRAVDALGERLDAIDARLSSPPSPPPPPPAPPPADDQRVVDAVRREAEMLTQRVAALAVGVEAARALLQQHVEETENSLGRKAGVVTRRLVADLGIGGTRRGRGGGRDRRQLGPGET